jgi:G3E family GTPase
MATRKSVPILVQTGFLGGGKTTLLGRWLREPACASAVAIINEIGEIGLDDRLARPVLDTALLIESGCACCEASEDLAGALESLFWDRLHRRIPDYERVIVETTGLADPAPILRLLGERALIAERYHVEGVVCVIDARLGAAQLAEFAECRAQLDAASVVALTKLDLATPDEHAATLAAIRARRPDAPALESREGDLPCAQLLAALAHAPDVTPAADGPARHTAGVTSAFAAAPDGADRATLETVLRAALDDFGSRLLRMKGLVRPNAGADWTVVQVAPDHVMRFSTLAPGAQVPPSGLTVIARDIPAGVIAARLRDRLARRAHVV